MKITKREILFICTGLFLLNFFLKLIFISYSDIGVDEPFTIYFSQRNFSGIMEMLKNENNPPLHFILIHFWIKLFGISAFSVRFPSVLFGSFSVIVIFLIGQKYFSSQIGLVAGLILTGSTLHRFYAHDARVYTMFFFIHSCSLYLYFNIIFSNDNKNRKMLFWLIITNILLCYSHFFGFIVIFVQVFISLLVPQFRKHFLIQLMSLLIVIGSFAWYFPILIERFKISSGGTWIPKPVITDVYSILWSFSNTPVLTVIFLCILFYSFLFNWKRINAASNNIYKILLLFFSIYFFGLFFISLIFPVFIARYLLFISLYYYLIIAISFVYIFKSKKLHLLIGLIPPMLMLTTLKLKEGKNTRINELSEFIKPLTKKQVSIIITPEWYDLNFIYYYNPKWFTLTQHLRDTLIAHSIFSVNQQNIIPLINPLKPIALINNNGHNDSLELFLKQKFKFKEEKNFNGGLKLLLFDVRKN